jgi:hypothetical protein
MNASHKVRDHSVTGADGSVFVNNSTDVYGSFYAIQIVANNSKVNFEGNLENWAHATALPTGFIIYGRFDKVNVTAGSAILHII